MAVRVLDAAGVVLLLACAYLVAVVGRRLLLQRGGATVELSLRLRTATPGRGWVLGVARYDGDRLHWYRLFSLAPRPRRQFVRGRVELGPRRAPTRMERPALQPDAVVIELRELRRSGGGPIEAAMSEATLGGLSAWIESAPPGSRFVPAE